MGAVISTREVEAAAAAGQNQLEVPSGAIVTPAAKDRARELGISFPSSGLNGANAAWRPAGNGNGHGWNTGAATAAAQPRTTGGQGSGPAAGNAGVQAGGSGSAGGNGHGWGLPATGGAGRWVRPQGAATPAAASAASQPGGIPNPGFAMADKPNYFGSPAIDNLYTISMELGAALWVVKDRLRVIEELLEKAGVLSEQAIEQYVADPNKRKQIVAERQAFIERIYRIIKDNPG